MTYEVLIFISGVFGFSRWLYTSTFLNFSKLDISRKILVQQISKMQNRIFAKPVSVSWNPNSTELQKQIYFETCMQMANGCGLQITISWLSEMTPIRSILFLYLFSFLFCKSVCDFTTNFLGNYLSDNEYNNKSLCWTKLCMQDSGRLIYAADHNSNQTSPCDDFKTFAMGTFFQHRVPNDRYKYTGFYFDIYLQYLEKLKRVMTKPVGNGDPKIFKVMKSFFRLCINSSKIWCLCNIQVLVCRWNLFKNNAEV